MKIESNSKPLPVEIERHGEQAEVILREHITEETGEEPVYTYDEYRLTVPYRENLLQSVEAAKAAWLEKAKASEYEALASAIREKRDRLLAESDREMSLDRLKLDVSSAMGLFASLASVFRGPWAVYRQALRDLPAQEGFPYDVKFPGKPER